VTLGHLVSLRSCNFPGFQQGIWYCLAIHTVWQAGLHAATGWSI